MNMKALFANACLLLGLALFSPCPHAAGSEPVTGMQAALDRMIAVQRLDARTSLDAQAAREAAGILQRTGAALIASNGDWNEAQQAIAREVLDELAPQVVETLHTERQLLLERLIPEMFRETYPRYFSADEISELSAYYASPTYKKMRPIWSRVESEARRTGIDKLTLWRQHAPAELTVEELLELRAFRISELGRKLDTVTPQLYRDWDLYWGPRSRVLIDAAMRGYGTEFSKRMRERQAAARAAGAGRD